MQIEECVLTRIALITGGGSGIGLACARTLAQNDYTVVITGRDQEKLDRAAKDIGSDHCKAIVCDITQPDQVEAFFKRFEKDYGRLDVLFNNAGNNVPSAPINRSFRS